MENGLCMLCSAVLVEPALKKNCLLSSYLFIFGCIWAFTVACGPALAAVNRGYSYGVRASRCGGFSSGGAQALEHRLTSCPCSCWARA